VRQKTRRGGRKGVEALRDFKLKISNFKMEAKATATIKTHGQFDFEHLG
jgi:hypothetical protein